MHRLPQIPLRQRSQARALLVVAAGLEAVRQVENAIERRHLRVGERMLGDCGQYLRIGHAEHVACQCRGERRVQNHRMLPGVRVDGNAVLFALAQQPVRRVEPGEVVQHARKARLCRIHSMPAREVFRHARDSHAVCVPVFLSEMIAYAFSELRKPHSSVERSARKRCL